MNRRLLSILLVLTALSAAAATFGDGKGLFNQRLGMFVHWGIYSVNGWHEQEEMRGKMPRSEYEKVAERFTAEKFDADAFVDAAELLGAEYIVFTSKHHDGFCMWDTATTDFKVTNTPTKRDVLKEVAEACRRRGMKLGLYYSNPDWHHPNAHNEKSTHQIPLQPGDEPDMATVLNDGASAECELVVMPGRWEAGRRTLHVGNIAAAKYADESLVVRLDFPESASEKLAVDRGDRVRDVLERYVGRCLGGVGQIRKDAFRLRRMGGRRESCADGDEYHVCGVLDDEDIQRGGDHGGH